MSGKKINLPLRNLLINFFPTAALLCTLLVLFQATCYAKDQVVLQLRWDHQFQFAGYYAAQWQGFYEEAGLEVEIRPAVTNTGKILSAVEEVASGRAQFGIGGADILKAYDQGKKPVVIASIFQHSAAAFYTRKDTQVKSPADFLKYKVARRVNDLIDIELQAMLLAEGVDPAKIKPYPHRPGADHLVSGQVDVMPGYSINIPFTARTIGVSLNEFRPIKYGIDFYGDSLFTSQHLTRENPDLVDRFINASLKGWRYALENRENLIERVSTELGTYRKINEVRKFNEYQAQEMISLIDFPDIELGHMNPARWERMHTYLSLIGLTENPLIIDDFVYDPVKHKQLEAQQRQNLLILLLGGAVVVLVIFSGWLYSLRKVVDSRTKDLRHSNVELAKSESKYRELIDITQEGIWVIDRKNNTTFVNPSMTRMLGYTVEEMMGRPLFDFMDDQGREIANKNLERRVQGIQEQHDFEFIRKDGKRVSAVIETAPILDEEGNYNGAIAGILDITERIEAEKEKEVLQRQLLQAQKMESIGNLAGGIAHDFNNILSSILGFSELALDDVEKDTTMEENLREIYAAGLRAKEVVNQILAFARQSDQELRPTRVDAIITEALRLIRPSTPATVEIRRELESSSLVMGNATQIHQMVMNLCTNAVHAMQEKGGVLQVTLEDRVFEDESEASLYGLDKGKYLKLQLSDTGSGIAEEHLDYIFDPYFTTKDTGEGTGMGLAMVRGIVESYGGNISVKSHSSSGTTFTIYLPVTSSLDDFIVLENETPVGGNEHILLVDDEPPIARMGSKILESLGYKVSCVTSGFEALELIRASPNGFDLVITDMTMPKLTGEKLALEIQKIRGDLPIILCTGYSNKINPDNARDFGISAFAYKPLSKSDLAKTIREVLDG